LRAKRKTIASLEDLLKETGRTRGREDRRIIRESRPTVQDTAVSTDNPTAPSQQVPQQPSKFFVMGPDGLCVEYPYKPRMTIQELKRDLKPTFLPKRSTRSSRHGGNSSISNINAIKIVYQGRVLLDENTMDDCQIRHGDTLVAIVEREEVEVEREDEIEKKKVTVTPAPAPLQDNTNRDSSIHLELLGKQTELINTMRYIYSNMHTMVKSFEDKIL